MAIFKSEVDIKIKNENAMKILNILQSHSLNSYLVGGAVRDLLMKFEPKDYDFCTDLSYEKLLEIFKDYKVKEIGKSFGIIQVTIDNESFEIAKFRKDIGVSEDRTLQEIEFTSSLEEDLKRRDFTINGIAYDGNGGVFYTDKDTLRNVSDREIRFIGNARDRLNEDPLRIFRMFRFMSEKNFNIDEKTDYEIECWLDKGGHERIESLSRERIRDEFNRMLLGKYFYTNFDWLLGSEVGRHIVNPSNVNICYYSNITEHMLRCVENIEYDLVLRLSAFFHDIGKYKTQTVDENGVHYHGHAKVGSELTREAMTSLKYPNKIIDTVCILVENHMNKSHRQTPKAMKKLINRVGFDNMPLLFKLMEADIVASSPPYDFENLDKMKILFHEICKENEKSPCLKVTDLALRGQDFINKGYKGKEIGDKQKELLELVLEKGSEFNTYENLIKLI